MNHTNNGLVSMSAGHDISATCSIRCYKNALSTPFSAALYREAGIVTAHYLELLLRVLLRTQVEQLFLSPYMKRRLTNAAILDRAALQRILRAGSQVRESQGDWLQTLGDRINLAHPQQLLEHVLLPTRGWWESSCSKEKQAWDILSTELTNQSRQLVAKRHFWMTQQLIDTKDIFIKQEINHISNKLSLIEQQLHEVKEKIEREQRNIDVAWPHWQAGLSALLRQNTLTTFEPVPSGLRHFWTQIVAIRHEKNTCHQIKGWLLQRELCLSHDEFYWQPDSRK